jgi:formylglycine-generating enzyme required for sulfatase activity
VEQVNWWESERTTRHHGLSLPTEAQWEFAYRAGTSTIWWSGNEKESLAGKVNLADQTYVDGGGWALALTWWPEFKDGYVVHAPAGSLAANGFGLHEVCGNVWEWCLDNYANYQPQKAQDPFIESPDATQRISRGGAFFQPGNNGRSTFRSAQLPDYRSDPVGLRAARSIEP